LPPSGVALYAGAVKLRQALNTPPAKQFKDVRFTANDVMTAWLKNARNNMRLSAAGPLAMLIRFIDLPR
jgi:hypothetical protein